MTDDIKHLIERLRSREEGVRADIKKSADRGNEQDRIHYVGWLRGIQGSRRLVEHLFKDKE